MANGQSMGTMQMFTVDKESGTRTPVGPPDYSRPASRDQWPKPQNMWKQRTAETVTPKARTRQQMQKRKAFLGQSGIPAK